VERMVTDLIFSIVAAAVSLGGLCVAFGVLKGKISNNEKTNAGQARQIEACATRDELAKTIKRSDEMLDMMRKRAAEDRAAGEGNYKELYGLISQHGERITKLETSHTAVLESLDEIKSDIKAGLRDVRDELKELRKGN